MLIALVIFFNARRIAGINRFFTGRPNKYEYGVFLQARLVAPIVFLVGLAILLGWIR